MRSTIAGHEFTYCHHDLSEEAQQLGRFMAENGISVDRIVELTARMVADGAFGWQEERAIDVRHCLTYLNLFVQSYAVLQNSISPVEPKRKLPTTEEGWREHLRKHGESQASKCEGWDPLAFKRKKETDGREGSE